jgi:pimeloyl-ACP methyl ester carboxylesterase
MRSTLSRHAPDTHPLFEKVLSTDRWANRVVSPLPFDTAHKGLPAVVVGPGWGKRPEIHAALLHELVAVGFRAFGVDSRFGYTDRQELGGRFCINTGSTNPYYGDVGQRRNRYELRRPTALLDLCERLEIHRLTYVGHSEGARIGLTAALAPVGAPQFDTMVLVNGVGTGKMGGPLGMMRANYHAIQTHRTSEVRTVDALFSFNDSVFHFVTHPRRVVFEAQTMGNFDAWDSMRNVAARGAKVHALNSRNDDLIDFASVQAASQEHPEIDFIATEGTHSNIYEPAMRGLIVDILRGSIDAPPSAE